MNNKISIIMPFLNEGDEPINTIKSIYETANSDYFEIIVIDDNSTDNLSPSRFNKFKEVKYIKNKERLGVGESRQVGIENASYDFILIIDAHMRFLNDNWLEKIINVLKEDPNTLLCTKSHVVKDSWDVNDKNIKVTQAGANIIPFSQKNNNNIILDSKWRSIKDNEKDLEDIQCVMGACYASTKNWFKHIRGFKGLRHWGSSEEFISLKTWLAGGSVKLLNTVGIGHIYNSSEKPPNYETNYDFILLNKIWVTFTIFDDETIYHMLRFINQDPRYNNAFKYFNERIVEAKKDQKYYRSIFKKDKNFLKTIGIDLNLNEKLLILLKNNENIKQLQKKLIIKNNIHNNYLNQLKTLDSIDIRQRKKDLIRDKLLNKYIPNSKKEIENIQKEIAKLSNQTNV